MLKGKPFMKSFNMCPGETRAKQTMVETQSKRHLNIQSTYIKEA